jgi:hypothetical protein
MASKRVQIQVGPTPGKAPGWDVKQDGVPIGHHQTKAPAVDQGAATGNAIQRRGGKAEMTIKKEDGKIQDKRTYGDDPKQTKG